RSNAAVRALIVDRTMDYIARRRDAKGHVHKAHGTGRLVSFSPRRGGGINGPLLPLRPAGARPPPPSYKKSRAMTRHAYLRLRLTSFSPLVFSLFCLAAVSVMSCAQPGTTGSGSGGNNGSGGGNNNSGGSNGSGGSNNNSGGSNGSGGSSSSGGSNGS